MKTYQDTIESIADSMGLRIVSMKNIGNDTFEVVIAYADSMDHVDLETSSKAAHAFAEGIDYEVGLDVSSEGAEKVIPLELVDTALDQYIYLKLKNPKDGFDHVEGDLVKIETDALEVKYKFKHTYKVLRVERNNIDLMRFAVKI